MNDGSLARYARAIERRWTEFVGRPAVLSPSDWRWISEWHGRGIPLQLILECLDAADERRREGRGAKRPRGLSYLAAAVDESWSTILDGRASPAEDDAPRVPREPFEDWRRRLDEEPEGTPLKILLAGLLARLEQGDDPEEIEAVLDRELCEALPPPDRQSAEHEARDWLEAHRSRMSAHEFEKAVQRAVTLRLRRRLKLPRLID